MKPETPYKRALISLVASIKQYIRLLDAEMKKPPSHDRGRRIGALTTALDMATDGIRFFTLGIDYRTGKRRKSSATAETTTARARKGFTASEMETILGQARRGLIESVADNDANGTGESLPTLILKGEATHRSRAPLPKKKNFPRKGAGNS